MTGVIVAEVQLAKAVAWTFIGAGMSLNAGLGVGDGVQQIETIFDIDSSAHTRGEAVERLAVDVCATAAMLGSLTLTFVELAEALQLGEAYRQRVDFYQDFKLAINDPASPFYVE